MKIIKIILRVLLIAPFIVGLPLGYECLTSEGHVIMYGWDAILSICGVFSWFIISALLAVGIMGAFMSVIIWLFKGTENA